MCILRSSLGVRFAVKSTDVNEVSSKFEELRKGATNCESALHLFGSGWWGSVNYPLGCFQVVHCKEQGSNGFGILDFPAAGHL